jgi:hypothetical protein
MFAAELEAGRLQLPSVGDLLCLGSEGVAHCQPQQCPAKTVEVGVGRGSCCRAKDWHYCSGGELALYLAPARIVGSTEPSPPSTPMTCPVIQP